VCLFVWKALVGSVKGFSYPAYLLPPLPLFNRFLRFILCSPPLIRPNNDH